MKSTIAVSNHIPITLNNLAFSMHLFTCLKLTCNSFHEMDYDINKFCRKPSKFLIKKISSI